MDSHGDPFGPKQHSDEGLESWLVAYADGITLILLFFLLLLSAAKFDVSRYDAMATGIMKDIAGRETISTTQLLKMTVQDTLYGMQADQQRQVSIQLGIVGIARGERYTLFHRRGNGGRPFQDDRARRD
jgi:flagellar motor protein MotB